MSTSGIGDEGLIIAASVYKHFFLHMFHLWFQATPPCKRSVGYGSVCNFYSSIVLHYYFHSLLKYGLTGRKLARGN